MKSSNNELPAALPSMWRALKRGYEAEPLLLSIAFSLSLIAALPDALLVLWLKFLAEGFLDQDRTLVMFAAVSLAITAAATWFLRIISDRTQRRFRDRVTIALESHVAHLQASVSGIEHHERPEYLDRLSILRDQVFVLDHMYMSLFSTAGWILRLVVIIILLMSVHPALVLLVLFALPTVASSTWRPGVERTVEETGAPANRLARHLFDTATTAPPGKEVRVLGIERDLVSRRRSAWNRWYEPVAETRWHSALYYMVGWAVFGFGYVGAIVFVAWGLQASPGSVLLVLAAGFRLSAYIGATVGELGFLRGIWMDGSIRMAWLEDYAASLVKDADTKVPEVLREGIKLEHVSFSYPGTDEKVLNDINLRLSAGSVIAIVGENGAGKSTLVKLLCRMYPPDEGRILIDGAELSRMAGDDWRCRLAGAFQDFFKFEYQARQTIGVGDLNHLEDLDVVESAVVRAGAEDVVKQLVSGLDTQLGPSWPDGVEVSYGQWQKLALARGFMRENPLLLILDEPTAALDAETEHALFERYTEAVQNNATANGRITILVSHRFSTVRMADHIVVLSGTELAETGSHDELMALGGLYAELYTIQAEAYH